MLAKIQGMIATLNLIGPADIFDILLVAFVLYKLYYMIKDTRAVALLKGLTVLLMAVLFSKSLELNVFSWLLQYVQTLILVALPIVFQPELRRALEQLGRGKLFRKGSFLNEAEQLEFLHALTKAIEVLAKNKIGALIVLERETRLNEVIETGIKVDGLVSGEFLINIFIPNTPLHDGAAIIRGNRVMAAGCLLPLTEDRNLNKELGTRHRAAIGVSEQTDAVVVIVSEETGVISIARAGKLTRYLDSEVLKGTLRPLFNIRNQPLTDLFSWRSTH